MQRRGYEECAVEMKKHRRVRPTGVLAEVGHNFFCGWLDLNSIGLGLSAAVAAVVLYAWRLFRVLHVHRFLMVLWHFFETSLV